MIDFVKWYFKNILEADKFYNNNIIVWFGRIWGVVVFPIVFLVVLIVYGIINIAEFLDRN